MAEERDDSAGPIPESEAATPGAGTRSVHAGERQELPRRPAVAPIYQTAPFLFDSSQELKQAFASGELDGLYSRYANPGVRVVEEKLAALEGAQAAVAFSSGMAAISSTLASLLRSGDRLIAAADIYGGTHEWIGWLGERHPEIEVRRAPLENLVETIHDVPAGAGVVFLESPTNPLLSCCDLPRVAVACHEKGLRLVVDNTFATPILQQPLALGADLVVHSATKYLAGHSDVTAGLVAGAVNLMEPIRQTQIVGGACLDPHAAFLLSRGMKTLSLRVERQSETAAHLAAVLSRNPEVLRVHYPGLDPVGRAQMRGGGGMIGFELATGEAAARLMDRLGIFQIIPSLGGVESGVMLPATTSHRQLTPRQRAALGITDGLVRLSCGIEDAADLEADLRTALGAIGT